MELLRFNLFNKAHKALRALLCNVLIELQQTDFSVSAESDSCISKIRLVLEVLHEHAQLEDNFIFPLLCPNAESIRAYFARQHIEDEALTLDLSIALDNIENAQTALQLSIAAISLQQQYIGFVAFNLNHMNMEEEIINPYLWSVYSDGALERLSAEAVRNNPPKHDAMFVGLMLEHLNNYEILSWLRNIRKEAPANVFQHFYNKSKEVLTSSRFNKIEKQLNNKD
ncbi:hypothetical protein DVR12_03920 [Chitinophaga silvatica]|uniref:Hemerythrin-like domain-containing protein n=1 Tax=Chitinophaga silvatica TaxID=2282649 RepID=A0A3E1YHU0_9BACT|nr:hemerythrin domain-containing protein [Chitinophaga silvatica]RFS26942.1 hypothetical protein DVR12_03920 [Chitinophaga silvatica]